jgi:flagellar protein FlbD
MILVTRLNGSDLWLTPLLIESMEETPDTIVTMTNGHKYVVRQSAQELAKAVADFMRGIGLVSASTRRDDTV